jgi:elongation factor G
VSNRYLTWDQDDQGVEMNVQEVPDEMRDAYQAGREALLEAVSETDDQIMEQYLGEEDIDPKELSLAIRNACCSLKLVPVFAGSALRNKGVQPVLDGVCAYLPSPLEVPPVKGVHPETGEPVERAAKEGDPPAALVFKVQMDQGRKLVYARIYSGTIKAGGEVYNVTKDQNEKVARLLRMHANKRERLDQAMAGEIVGIMGLKNSSTGDTLATREKPLLLDPMQLYEPVISVAVEPKTVGDQEKIAQTLDKLADEDPTFRVRVDEDTGQTIISGMGELHLEVLVHRIKREYNLDVNVGRPQVVYRETVTKTASFSETFDRDLGGERQVGSITVAVSPNPRNEGNSFSITASEEQVPGVYHQVLQQAAEESFTSGVVLGYPVLDTKVVVTGGEYSQGVSTELGYRLALSMALKRALSAAEPVLLEPVMKVEVVVPEEFMGEIIGDLNSRGGAVEAVEPKGGTNIVKARAPLAAMFGYSTALRSASQGRAMFTMHFSHYDRVEKKQ